MAAGAVGTTVEWYDYFIYGTAAAVVFNKLFFPTFDSLAGTLTAFATFGVGFLARPVGAVVFGHFGDRIGRKHMLVLSLLIMGIATAGIGVLPTYATIGVWAPILLVVLRLLQGFAVGGEWGGATVLMAEYSPPGKRGLYGSVVQIGSPAGLVLSSGGFALVKALPANDFLAWGWRLPFLASLVMIAIGLYIRLNIVESAEFRETLARREQPRVPAVEVVRTSKKNLLIAMGARFAPDIGFYVCGTFIVTYASLRLHVATGTILFVVAAAAFVEALVIPLFGMLSDRIGRRAVYLGGAAFWIVFGFPFFWLVDTSSAPAVWLAIGLAFVIGHGSMWSIGGAMYSEMFDTKFRYSGVSLGYQFAAILGGGPAPFVATALIAWSGGASWPVALYLVVVGAITFFSVRVASPIPAGRVARQAGADLAGDAR
jgi:metabolite-proton symporter